MSEFLSYTATIDYIMSKLPMYQRLGAAAYKADLSSTITWLDHLGNPQKRFRAIHIAGTNGKGSVSHCLASVFQSAGYKTGLYTSPHLTDFRERIRVDGQMIDKKYITRFIANHKSFLDELKPSFFEMSVGLAFQFFADQDIDMAIIETGMGGRLDSTNLIIPELSVISNIGFDHTAFLGSSLREIAAEKAGIIKPGIPVIIGETHEETSDVFKQFATNNRSEILFADAETSARVIQHKLVPPVLQLSISTPKTKYHSKSPLAGLYQIKNLQTVVLAIEKMRELGYQLPRNAVKHGLQKVIEQTGLRGRWMVFGNNPPVIMDTGHNADGLNYVTKMLESLPCSELHMVIGMVDDKNHEVLLKMLPAKAKYYLCKPSVPRGYDAQLLLPKALTAGLNAEAFSNVKQAFQAAKKNAHKNDVIFVGGSTFTVADALALKEFSRVV